MAYYNLFFLGNFKSFRKFGILLIALAFSENSFSNYNKLLEHFQQPHSPKIHSSIMAGNETSLVNYNVVPKCSNSYRKVSEQNVKTIVFDSFKYNGVNGKKHEWLHYL